MIHTRIYVHTFKFIIDGCLHRFYFLHAALVEQLQGHNQEYYDGIGDEDDVDEDEEDDEDNYNDDDDEDGDDMM